MTRDEVKSAILETITANDQKGITAESLANILLEMVDVSGGSGGDGSSSEGETEHGVDVLRFYATSVLDHIDSTMTEVDESGLYYLLLQQNLKVAETINGIMSGLDNDIMPAFPPVVIDYTFDLLFEMGLPRSEPGVFRFSTDGELLIVPAQEYVDTGQFRDMSDCSVGYKLLSDGGYSRINPTILYYPSGGTTEMCSLFKAQNLKTLSAIQSNAVRPSMIQVIPSFGITDGDSEGDIFVQANDTGFTNFIMKQFVAYGSGGTVIHTATNMSSGESAIIFLDVRGIHVLSISADGNAVVTNLLTFNS